VDSAETRSDGRQPGSGETTNVVRIPRDWFGPREELVPFGPRAAQLEAEREASADRVSEQASAPGDLPLDPNMFWGEDATSIHDVVDAPSWPAADGDAGAAGSSAADESAQIGAGYGRRLRRGVGWLTPRHKALASGIALALALGVGLASWLLTGSPRRAHGPIAASITDQQSRAPARHIAESTGSALAMHGLRIHPTRRIPHRVRRGPIAHRASVTPVVYHPSETVSPPSNVSYGPSGSGESSPTSSAGTGGGGGGSAAASRSQTSQPAFGADGALGPVSSPNG
jgi:hypothetical protein